MSVMTWIAYGEAPDRTQLEGPRFALCVWLAILELAKGASKWQGTRSRLAEVASALLPPDRFAERHSARTATVAPRAGFSP